MNKFLLSNKSLPAASSGVSQRDKFVSSVHPRSKLRGILAQNKKLIFDIVVIVILTILGIILVKTQILPRLGGFYR